MQHGAQTTAQRDCGGVRLTSAIQLHYNLTKLMVSHDLPRSTITDQIAFDQRDLHWTPEFERMMDQPLLPGAGFQIGNLRYHHFYLTD